MNKQLLSILGLNNITLTNQEKIQLKQYINDQMEEYEVIANDLDTVIAIDSLTERIILAIDQTTLDSIITELGHDIIRIEVEPKPMPLSNKADEQLYNSAKQLYTYMQIEESLSQFKQILRQRDIFIKAYESYKQEK